jgi:hypothetical protein
MTMAARSMTTTTDNTANPAFTLSMPSLLIRLEGLALLIGAAAVYAWLGGSGWLFALLFFTPDFAMIGYLRGTRIGAIVYNSVHTYVAPALLAGIALAANWEPGLLLALILGAHISFDRIFGYGLKYASAFKDTHLQRL